MAPKEKKKSKKKSHHQSLRSVPGVIPGTSTLSLPTLGSSFPHEYAPDTPSYSLDLCKLLLETAPNTNTYYDFFIHQPIQELILNLLTVHGLSNNAQAVKDYLARIKGNQPSASISGSVRKIIGDLNLSLQQKQSVMETIYRNYKAAVDYYEKKAEEASKELKHLDTVLRESFLQQSETFHVIKQEGDSTENTSESAVQEEPVDESTLGAVGGEPAPTRKKIDSKNKSAQKGKDTKKDDGTSDDRFDDSSLGAVGGIQLHAEPDSEDKDVQAKEKSTTETQKSAPKKNRVSKLINLWEVRATQGSTEALITEIDHTEIDQTEEVLEYSKAEEDVSETNVDPTSLEGEGDDVSEQEEKEPEIIVPFHTSQMNIPLLRPNLLITSEVGTTSVLMSTHIEDSESSSIAQSSQPSKTQDTSLTTTTTDTGPRDSLPPESSDEQGDPDAALRLPRPLTERKEKYPKEAETDEPIVISPAALGGTSYRITSNIPQMPIGSPRNYQVLERSVIIDGVEYPFSQERNEITFGNRVVNADEYLRRRRQKYTQKKSGFFSWMRSLSSRIISKMFKSSRSKDNLKEKPLIKQNGISSDEKEIPYTNGYLSETDETSLYKDEDRYLSQCSLYTSGSSESSLNGHVDVKEISIIKSNGFLVRENVQTFHCNVTIPI